VRPCRLAADCTTRLGDADGAVPRVQGAGVPSEGAQGLAPVRKHFAPAIRVGEFEQWLVALGAHSRELAVHLGLTRPLDQLPARLQRPSRTVPCSLYAERTYEAGDGLRDVSRRSSGRSGVRGDDGVETKKLRVKCLAVEYRWWQAQNSLRGFDAPPGVVDLGNTHRRQSRELWNHTKDPKCDERPWGGDEVFDLLRAAGADRDIADSTQSGAALGRALARAARCVDIQL
jgi:hypothetical protein